MMFKRKMLTIVLASAVTTPFTQAGEKHVSKNDLTAESASGILALIRPQESEWRHLKVSWITDVVAARRQAAKEDKPIVVLYTGGAGYNEPLGVC